MSVNLEKKWATFTHVRELKLWGKCEPIMSHVREWTSERGVHVHVCPALVVMHPVFYVYPTCTTYSKVIVLYNSEGLLWAR